MTRLRRERHTTWVLIAICFALICATVYSINQVRDLRVKVDAQSARVAIQQDLISEQQDKIAQQQRTIRNQQRQSYAGCVRGNVLRAQARYALIQLGAVHRAQLPELSKQPCARLYPEGVPK